MSQITTGNLLEKHLFHIKHLSESEPVIYCNSLSPKIVFLNCREYRFLENSDVVEKNLVTSDIDVLGRFTTKTFPKLRTL